MIWGIVLIGLLIDGDCICDFSFEPYYRPLPGAPDGISRQLITWWNSVRRYERRPARMGAPAPAMKPAHRLWGSEGVGRAVPEVQVEDARPRRHPPGALLLRCWTSHAHFSPATAAPGV